MHIKRLVSNVLHGTERDKNANYPCLNYFYNINSHVISYDF